MQGSVAKTTSQIKWYDWFSPNDLQPWAWIWEIHHLHLRQFIIFLNVYQMPVVISRLLVLNLLIWASMNCWCWQMELSLIKLWLNWTSAITALNPAWWSSCSKLFLTTARSLIWTCQATSWIMNLLSTLLICWKATSNCTPLTSQIIPSVQKEPSISWRAS